MSFAVLTEVASEWEPLGPRAEGSGESAAALLRTARSLFAHAWFNYEFMVVACLVGLQAMEAAFRSLYPTATNAPLLRLVRRSVREGMLPPEVGSDAEWAVQLRNELSHPETQWAFTIGMAGRALEDIHRLVAAVVAAAVDAS